MRIMIALKLCVYSYVSLSYANLKLQKHFLEYFCQFFFCINITKLYSHLLYGYILFEGVFILSWKTRQKYFKIKKNK